MKPVLALCIAWTFFMVACAGMRLGSGGAHWLRVRTPHFTLHTDLAEREARARAELLEHYLAAYLQHGWQARGELPLQLNVVMFARPSEFQEFARWDADGYFVSALFEPWVVLPAYRREQGLTILRHELTHYLAYSAMQDQPSWFAEGIACYFQTARLEPDGTFVVGKVPTALHALLMRGARVKADYLFSGSEGVPDPAFYASAWLLVHYLMSERGESFVRYQAGLARGLGDREAWREAFPDLDTQQLDRELDLYASAGAFANYTRPVTKSAVPVQLAHLSQADEYALRALLDANCFGCSPAIRARADESVRLALALNPHQLQASVMSLASTRADRAPAYEEARTLVAEHPQAWLAWLTLAASALDRGHDQAAMEAVSRTLELAPRQAHARMLAAWTYLKTGRPQDALRESAQAAALQPTSLPLLKERAALLAELRECKPLEQTVRALLAVGHQALSDQELAHYRALTAQCAGH